MPVINPFSRIVRISLPIRVTDSCLGISQEKEKNMSQKVKRITPLLLAALVSLVVIGTGAAIVLWWRSSNVTTQFTFSVEGIDSYIIDIPDTGTPIADYTSFLDYFADPESHVATQLITSSLKENAFGFDVVRSFAYCYEGGNIAGDLVLDIECNITGDGAANVDWTVTTHLAGVYANSADGGSPCMQDSDLVDYVFDGSDRLIIPAAEMSRVTWVDVADYVSSPGIPVGYANVMFLEFTFTGGGEGIDTTLYGDHTVDISIAIKASIDEA